MMDRAVRLRNIEGCLTMGQFFQVHPDNPQRRLLTQAVDIIRGGGLIIYPTDSSYAIGCHIGDKQAMDRMRRLRRLDDKHNFTLMCRDLSEIASYAKTIGIRVPDNPVCRDLLGILNEPLMSSTLILPGDELPMTDPYEMRQTLGHEVDLIIDGGYCGLEPTTVIALYEDPPVVLRLGKGDPKVVEEA
jgi:tRNA A37 threonylcarbamoyladenosine synthetase subunit TsaC/SUA5/YrdC